VFLLALAASMTIAILPQGSSPRFTIAAAQGKAADASALYRDVYNGWKWWHVYCYRCHGQNAIGATLAPNLIDPNLRLSLPDFLQTVREGVPENGMQAWNKLLDDKQIIQLYYYVIARMDKVLPPGRPDEVGPKGGPWAPPKGWSPTNPSARR
jgi:mono/diheme cytochrome c family protein